MNDIKVNIPVLTDDDGFVGRECPECEEYFMLKYGTGLDTEICICPYCQHENNNDQYYTKEQVKYIESYMRKYAFERIIKPGLAQIDKSFKDLERKTRNSLIQFKVKSNISKINFRIDYYQEKELETYILCDSCGLEFSIFGVFATCPDCGQLSAITVFRKSIEVIRKKLVLSEKLDDQELIKSFLEDALNNSISAFDSLGKALIKKYEKILKTKSQNLFQNISLLSETLKVNKGKSIDELIGIDSCKFLIKMFQVRHIYEHNFGEIDIQFIKKLPDFENKLKRKYILERSEINRLINEIEQLGNMIINYLK